ncbi:TRAP transporter large permease [Halomonas elongata]|uniref:TRAP transporter large permease protein n=1 Tax=Halomonas elongata (strain ATCC 33173 / DSM 2581 / NBRC 15536 / NCIMB 2198 / 1H9) TaxID=768066 RepID=E1V6N3_HALED|nr:TRAP transporter large permease [Halomonas elongata]WBF18596.1 TRAP transporter large permease [Halomonas elongata]WPU47450.1 TRAP transporter large permease [Halomonas elongata DSM 2581]CBV41362.1 TRAP transporter large transmembrane protein [Halomonas elongata DSM 2581]
MTLTLLVLFAAGLILGIPIAVCLGVSSVITILLHDLPFAVVAQRSVNALDSTPLLAVPLFIFAASLLSATGVTSHLFELTRLFVGRLRGGVAQVNVLVSLIFSGMSGAALADIGALGGIQIKMMEAQGYMRRFAAGTTIAAATIGPIFPPSIPLIIFASAAEVSAVRALLAGVVPALIVTAALMVQIAIMARRGNLPRDTHRPSASEIGRKFTISLPALLAPVLMIAGLLSGVFGPTEVAGVIVAYSVVIGILFYRSLTVQRFFTAARESVEASANILFIVATAALFAWVLTIGGVPAMAGQWLLSISTDPLVLLLILNVLLLVAGMFLESIAAILIIAPIVAPTLMMAGVPAEQLGVIFVLNLMIGLLTPPIGMSLYMVSIITRMEFGEVVRGVLPFYLPLFVALVVVTLFPGFSTWLPNLIMQ